MSNAISRSRAPPSALLDQYLKIAEQCLTDGDVQTAYQASRLGTRVARELKDPGSLNRAKQVELHVNDVNRQIKPLVAMAAKLKTHPDDPEANFLLGRYWCFFRGNWEEGLPMLAKGSDVHLAELAKADLETSSDAAGMLKVADAWWSLPDSPETPQRRSHQRAAHWYKIALPQLKGADEQIAKQRIAASNGK